MYKFKINNLSKKKMISIEKGIENLIKYISLKNGKV